MLSGISIWQLLILLVIVVLVFGTKRIRNLGGDLGSALKDFRGAMKDEDKEKQEGDEDDETDPKVVDHVHRENASTTESEKSESDRRE